MPLPIQVWASFITLSPLDPGFSRDLQRAQRMRQNEVRVWLRPDVAETTRWATLENGVRVTEALIRGEQTNAFTIYHIDDQRRLYPSMGTPESPVLKLPEGLYRTWVTTLVEFIEAPKTFTWKMPFVVDDGVCFGDALVSTDPGPILPRAGMSLDDHVVEMKWPPDGTNHPQPVSPETESVQHYGQPRRYQLQVGDEQFEVIGAEHDPSMRAAAIWLKWSKPFDVMFPIGGGIDVLYHQAVMLECIKEAVNGNHERALQVAEDWVQRLVGVGHSTLEQAWLLPRFNVNVNAGLLDVEGRFNLSFASVQELLASNFRERLLDRLEVQRINGWVGYFWWELYCDLKANTTLRFCARCGQLIRGGRADREYCTFEESPSCYRKRNAVRQKDARAARRKRTRSRSSHSRD